MKDYVNQHFKIHKGPVRPSIRMNDGTYVSVQASEFHYCEPRENDVEKYYTVEVFNWPIGDTYFHDHGGDEDNPAAFVPVGIVNFYIEKHGGIYEEL
jgi:hypothetical protein